MTALAQRQLAERRLKQFERSILGAATTMGHDQPQDIAEAAVHLARHAALAVAFDPGLLHLLRINFFIDRDRLPYWVEARLLLSTLCRDAEGGGLYVMDAPVRELLLSQLTQTRGGAERMRDVAMLLWQYTERHGAWLDRQELRHAQQLTALNFLAPERAMAWLDEAELGSGSEVLPKEWFVAMRSELPELPSIRHEGDPAAVCEALLDLDFAAQRAGHRGALRSPGVKIYVLGGPPDHAQQWVLLRLLRHREVTPALVQVTVSSGSSPAVQRSLAEAIGLGPNASWAALRERTAALAQAGPLAIAVDGAQHLDAAEQSGLQRLVDGSLPVWLYVLEEAAGSGAVFGQPSASGFGGPDFKIAYLPRIEAITADDLRSWIERYGAQAGFDRDKSAAPQPVAEVARQVLAATGGVPRRVLEHLCMRCSVRWPDVLAHAQARFSAQLPAAGDPVAELAQTYQTRRAGLKPGPARTRAMEEVVARMRTLLATRSDWALAQWIDSPSAGMRLAAAVLLQLQPRASHCEWLGLRVRNETPFIAYHALLALMNAASELPVDQLDAVAAAVAQAAADLAPRDARSDRADLLRRTERILSERRVDKKNSLPLLPLRDAVLFPKQTALVQVERLEALSGLLQLTKTNGHGMVFVVHDAGIGSTFDRQRLARVGTVALAHDIQKSEQGFRVALDGNRRATGRPTEDLRAGHPERFEITPLPDIEDWAVSASERAELSNALQALARIGGLRSAAMSALPIAPIVQTCYELAAELDLPIAERQRLLEQDDARQMLRQMVAAVFLRIEAELPGELGSDGWGQERLIAILNGAFVDPDERALLTTAFDVSGAGSHAIKTLVEMASANGRLRAVAAHALGRRPDNEALWEHVEAMGALPPKKAGQLPPPPKRGAPLKLWPNGSTLRIRFLGGDAKLKVRVMQCAEQWLRYANLHFTVLGPRDKSPADIRIAFDRSHAAWCYCGTDAQSIAADEPTMSLDSLTLQTAEPEFQATVLKQFGHALGLLQEHQNPNSNIQWDRDALMKAMTAPPNNWAQQDVEQNILLRARQTSPRYRDFDNQSVMLGNFEAEWLADGQPLRGGTRLSVSDKQFIARLYPGTTEAGRMARPIAKRPVSKGRRAA